MSTATLEPTGSGLRARLEESVWAAALQAAGIDDAGALAVLPGYDAGLAAGVDDAVRDTARAAAGPSPLVFEVLTGHGEAGVLARLTTDGSVATVAARVVVPGAGSTPTAVPGVELSLTGAEHVVGEIMRTFPPVGVRRRLDDRPVTLPRDVAVAVVRALTGGDRAAAQAAYAATGDGELPAVLEALGEGPVASATVTLRAVGRVVVLQWLCTDDGWVALSTHGTEVVHTARSREEIRDDLVALMAGELTALADRVSGPASGGSDG